MAGLNIGVGGDFLDLENFSASTLAVSAAAAQTAVLAEGKYAVWCTVDCYLKVGPTANDVTVANGYLLRVNTTATLVVRGTSRIGAIAGGAGTLSFHKVA